MSSFSRKFLAFCGLTALLFIAVISGGCGGGSSSFLPIDIVDANSILTGGWIIDTSANNSISADVNGEVVNFAIHNFAAKLSSVDVENSTGSAYLQALAILSDDNLLIPLAYDLTKLTTTMSLTESNKWVVESQHSLCTITLKDAESSNPKLNISGIVRFIGDSYAVINVNLKKFNETAKSESEMNALVNGNWQTRLDAYSGGFIFMSADMGGNSGTAAPDNPGILRIPGMAEIDNIYFSGKFANTSLASGKSTMSSMSFFAFLNDEVSRDWAGDGPLMPWIDDGLEIKISNFFGNIYELEIPFSDAYRATFPNLEVITYKTFFIIEGDNAYVITVTLLKGGNSYAEMRSTFELERKPDKSDVDVTGYIGTAWDSFWATGQKINYTTATPAINNLRIRNLGLAFPEASADVTTGKFSASIKAEYEEIANPPAPPTEGTSPDVKVLITEINFANVKQLAYNTWYATDESGESDFAFTLLDSPVGGTPMALIFANISSGLVGGSNISLAAFVTEAGDMDDVFFNGAWLWRPGNDVKVEFVLPTDSSQRLNANLINFGAYFSSIDVDAGTANFSVVSVLSVDAPTQNNAIIPMVYDNISLKITADEEKPDTWNVETPNGSKFVITRLDPASNGSARANIKGTLNYEALGFNISVDAVVSKSSSEAATIDFDSVMKDSTWYTKLKGSINSGGFWVMQNASQSAVYPANPGKILASLAFSGDYNNAVITGSGIMNTPAGTIPVTMVNEKIKTQHMFNNFYRFDFASGDSAIKGVCMLDSAESMRLILEADNKIGSNNQIRVHALLSLWKSNDPEVSITNLVNTSWTYEHSNGFLVSGDMVLRYSDLTEYNTELIHDKFDVTFGDRIGSQNAVSFDAVISFYPATNPDAEIDMSFNGIIDIYRAGRNMWYAIAREHKSQFVLTLTPNETGSGNHIILTANLNIPRNGRYFYVVNGSTMVRK